MRHTPTPQPRVHSHDLRKIIEKDAFAKRVTYFRGNPMLDKDLVRGRLRSASGVYVLSRASQGGNESLDTCTNLITSAVRAYSARATRGRYYPIITEILASDNAPHARLAGATRVIALQHFRYAACEHICAAFACCYCCWMFFLACADVLLSGVLLLTPRVPACSYATLAVNVSIPGFTTFVGNLCSTFPLRDLSNMPLWKQEYVCGLCSRLSPGEGTRARACVCVCVAWM